MRVLKQAFNAGEFTPRLHSRYEVEKYKNGCKTLTNMVPLAHGPVARRPGTEYIGAVKNAADNTVLIPFEFSETDSYIIEAGDLYARYYKNGGQIQTADANTKLLLHCDGPNNDTNFLDSSPSAHTIVNGAAIPVRHSTYIQKFGVSSAYGYTNDTCYLSVADHADWNLGAGNFTIDLWLYASVRLADFAILSQWQDASNYYELFYDYTDNTDGKLKFRVVVAGVEEVLLEYNWPAIGGIEKHTWYHIAVVRGWGGNANDWALCIDGTAVATDTVNYTIPDLTGELRIRWTQSASIFKGSVDEVRISSVARWTAGFGVPGSQYPSGDDSGTVLETVTTYAAEDIDKVQYAQSADTMYIVHKDYVVRKLVRSSDVSWAISNVSFTTPPAAWSAGDYPRTIEFYEDRLCFGGSPDQPDTVWTSDTGTYTVFTATAADDEAITHTLGARRVNDIQWLSAGRRLIVGTAGEEWWLSGPSDTEPITPTSKVSKRDSAWGSAKSMAVNIGDVVFYIQKGGKSIREMVYDFGKDRYTSSDLNILAEHLTRNFSITSMAYQQHPYQILWCTREDGTLLALTYLKEHDVIGWSKHTSGAEGAFESVAVIPGPGEDEVWFVVKREIDGSEVRYIEKLKPFNYGTSLEDAFFVDSGLTYNGAAATTISGLDHLEGEAVAVLSDGVVVTGHTVSSGAITLASAASKVHIGLAYTPELETLDAVVEDEEGSLQGIEGRITNVSIRLIDSMGGQYGPDAATTDEIIYDDETALFTGWTRDLSFDEGHERDRTVYITSNEPLPLEVAAINIDLED